MIGDEMAVSWRDPIEETLREVCERLAPIDRTPCSAGEREAAEWIAERLRGIANWDVALEEEPSWGGFPPTGTALALLGAAGAASALAGRRVTGALLGAASLAGIIDEVENGPRIVRRLLRRRRTTVNVHARLLEPDAVHTLVVLAHHDAAQTGLVFDQRLLRAVNDRFPGLLRRIKTQPPQWWIGAFAPAGAAASAVSGRRGPAVVGLLAGLLATGLVADIWRSPTVPGANDNLSAVAALIAFAELLRDDPVPGLAVRLVSAGAEETLQDGIRGFIARHRHELDPAQTSVLVADTIGSPRLIMCEGEGPFRIQEYSGASLRDLVERCARANGIALERGFRARASTDAVIPSRAGLPTVLLASLNEWQAMSSYHLMSDVPDNLDYGTIAAATRLVHAVGRALAPDTPDTPEVQEVREMRLECGELTARVTGGPLLSVTSLCLSGRELLVDPAEIPVHYRVHGSRAGITLMHPWANRVGADVFTVGDHAITLGPDDAGVTRDGNGLAIHGLRSASGWKLERRSEGSCVAWLEFAPIPGFPFRHRAEVSLELTAPGTLTIETTILAGEPGGAGPGDPGGAGPGDPGRAGPGDPGGVPVAFGWHPYFRVERNPEDELVMPRCSRLSLDERGLPTGESLPVAEGAAPIGEQRFDDLFAEIETGEGFGWRTTDLELAVIHEHRYPFAQVFVPGDAPVLSLEPMTAPTDALRTGRELPVATSATPFTARFSVVVRA